jgi:hypothetical protein
MVLLTRQSDGLISEANQYFESCSAGRCRRHRPHHPGAGPVGHPEQRAQLVKATQRKGEPITMEVQFCASNGQIHDGILSAQKVELEGEPT